MSGGECRLVNGREVAQKPEFKQFPQPKYRDKLSNKLKNKILEVENRGETPEREEKSPTTPRASSPEPSMMSADHGAQIPSTR